MGHRGPRRAGGLRAGLSICAGQTPIDDERFAKRAEQDIGRLQIAVNDAAAVGEGYRFADVQEPPQELLKFDTAKRVRAGVPLMIVLHGVLKTLPADQPHGIERPAFWVVAQTVYRD